MVVLVRTIQALVFACLLGRFRPCPLPSTRTEHVSETGAEKKKQENLLSCVHHKDLTSTTGIHRQSSKAVLNPQRHN